MQIKIMNYVLLFVLFIIVIVANSIEEKPFTVEPPIIYVPTYIDEVPTRYRKRVQSVCDTTGVPVRIVYNLVKVESNWKNNVYNKNTDGSYDRGLFQLNSRYVKYFADKFNGGKLNPYSPTDSIRVGVRYLAWLYKQCGSWERAVASYNWGIGNVKSGKTYPKCVKMYVKKVLSL